MQNPYDLIADEWHENCRGQAYVERVLSYVDRILCGLPAGARVLDLGWGTGNPIALHIARKGYRVVGVDQSAKMLEIAKGVLPEAEFIHADMVSVELKDRFAAAVAWDSVFHVERKYHAGIYRKLSSCMERGARLLLSVGGTDARYVSSDEAEGFTSEMFGQTFFYSGYSPCVARGLLEDAGFRIETWEVDDPSSHGHIAVIARKA